MVGDEDADTALFQHLDHALNVGHGDRIDACERFVEKQENGIQRQRSRDFDTAAFTAGKRERFLVRDRVEVEIVEKAVQVILPSDSDSGRVSRTERMFSSAVIRRKTEASCGRYATPFCARLCIGHSVMSSSVEKHAAAVGFDETHGHIKRSRLSRAVGSQQSHDLPRLDFEAHVVDHRASLIGLQEADVLKGVDSAGGWVLRLGLGFRVLKPLLCSTSTISLSRCMMILSPVSVSSS